MHALLVLAAVLGVVLLLAVLGVVVAVVLAMRRLVHRNRVATGVPTPAPLWWLASPATPARLHRRLRTAVRTVEVAAPPRRRRAGVSPLAELVDDLPSAAQTADARLVQAARQPLAVRRRLVRDVFGEVLEVEALAGRLESVLRTWGAAPGETAPLAVLRQRIDSMDAAFAELDGLGATGALRAPTPGLAIDRAETVRPTRQPLARRLRS